MLLQEADAVYTCTSLLTRARTCESYSDLETREGEHGRMYSTVTVRHVRGSMVECTVSVQLAHAIPTLTTARWAHYNSTQCWRFPVCAS